MTLIVFYLYVITSDLGLGIASKKSVRREKCEALDVDNRTCTRVGALNQHGKKHNPIRRNVKSIILNCTGPAWCFMAAPSHREKAIDPQQLINMKNLETRIFYFFTD